MAIIQASTSCQSMFFAACQEEKLELPEDLTTFLKRVLEGGYEHMQQLKEHLVKQGDPAGFSIVSAAEVLHNIILKIPNPSLIIMP